MDIWTLEQKDNLTGTQIKYANNLVMWPSAVCIFEPKNDNLTVFYDISVNSEIDPSSYQTQSSTLKFKTF